MRERYGDWALVTGASAGIGEAFARALAREGMSVVLTARRGDRLDALASELEKTFSVQTRVVEEDLANAEGAERVARAVSDLPIAVLVNNAGFGAAGRFDKLQAERLRDMVTVNCVAPMLLARRILPRMQERGRGAVIFTGSVSGRQPLPLHGVYAATKAFDQLLGEALYVEQRRFGIDVLVVEPGETETEFHGVASELPARRVARGGGRDRARGARAPALGGVGLVQLAAREPRAADRAALAGRLPRARVHAAADARGPPVSPTRARTGS
jgi:short-subunit dehydrogenase